MAGGGSAELEPGPGTLAPHFRLRPSWWKGLKLEPPRPIRLVHHEGDPTEMAIYLVTLDDKCGCSWLQVAVTAGSVREAKTIGGSLIRAAHPGIPERRRIGAGRCRKPRETGQVVELPEPAENAGRGR